MLVYVIATNRFALFSMIRFASGHGKDLFETTHSEEQKDVALKRKFGECRRREESNRLAGDLFH
jgi:hypothetical protein